MMKCKLFLVFLIVILALGFFERFNVYASSFGYTSIGGFGVEISNSSTEQITGSIFTISERGIADSITVALKRDVAGSNNAKCAIYKHSDLSLVGVTEQVLVSLTTSFAWYTFNFAEPKPVLTANEVYLLVVWVDYTASNIDIAYAIGATNQGHMRTLTYDSFPDPLTFPTHSNRKFSIYCTYTTGSVFAAFVVANPASLTAKETAIKSRVEGWGWAVALKDDNAAADSWNPEDFDGVIISQSVSSGNVAWMCDEAVGFLNYEAALFDDFDMATGYSDEATQTQINIVDNGHYVTSPYSTGNLTVTSSVTYRTALSWSNDSNDLAQKVGDATKATILEIDKNENGVSGNPVPERRVMWAMGAAEGSDSFNDDGWNLFDRALKWVSHQDAPPPAGQPYISRVQRVAGMRTWGGICSFYKRFPAFKPRKVA